MGEIWQMARKTRKRVFLPVNVRTTKGKIFIYHCVVKDLDDDNEIEITCFRYIKERTDFRLDGHGVFYILPEPEVTNKLPQ